jgi:hypothetical protein
MFVASVASGFGLIHFVAMQAVTHGVTPVTSDIG